MILRTAVGLENICVVNSMRLVKIREVEIALMRGYLWKLKVFLANMQTSIFDEKYEQ